MQEIVQTASRGGTRDMHHMYQRIQHDVWYIKHWSLWLDIQICALTGVRLLTGAMDKRHSDGRAANA